MEMRCTCIVDVHRRSWHIFQPLCSCVKRTKSDMIKTELDSQEPWVHFIKDKCPTLDSATVYWWSPSIGGRMQSFDSFFVKLDKLLRKKWVNWSVKGDRPRLQEVCFRHVLTYQNPSCYDMLARQFSDTSHPHRNCEQNIGCHCSTQNTRSPGDLQQQ